MDSLLHDLFEHGALAGAHATAHQEQDGAAVAVRCRDHHLGAARPVLVVAAYPDGLELIHQRGEQPGHLQLSRHPLKPHLPRVKSQNSYLQ
jgi:hypothetical protein